MQPQTTSTLLCPLSAAASDLEGDLLDWKHCCSSRHKKKKKALRVSHGKTLLKECNGTSDMFIVPWPWELSALQLTVRNTCANRQNASKWIKHTAKTEYGNTASSTDVMNTAVWVSSNTTYRRATKHSNNKRIPTVRHFIVSSGNRFGCCTDDNGRRYLFSPKIVSLSPGLLCCDWLAVEGFSLATQGWCKIRCCFADNTSASVF